MAAFTKCIGVDFSLNSPAFCVLEANKASWVSLYRSKYDWLKLVSMKSTTFSQLTQVNELCIELLPEMKASGEYYEVEKTKLFKFNALANSFFKKLEPFLERDTKVFMEGISFGSTSSSLIDISMATALLRKLIADVVGVENFFVFSPGAIKKFAIKGNAKKWELYETIILHKDARIAQFTDTLRINKSEWIKSNEKKDVADPCSDLIDATWISLFGEHFLETFENI